MRCNLWPSGGSIEYKMRNLTMLQLNLKRSATVIVMVLLQTIALPVLLQAQDAPRTLTLPQAIKLALEKNPDLATAQLRIKGARAAFDQISASFWPQVSLAAGYAASDNPVQSFMMTLNQRALNMATANFNHPGATDNFNGGVIAQYSLFNGGRDTAARKATKLGAEALENNRDAVRNDLIFEVTRSYYTVIKARQFVTTASAAVASMDANLTVASNRFAQGSVLKSDFLDAQVRLAAARENSVLATNALALSEVFFRNILGVGENNNITVAESTAITVPTNTTTTASRRPELLAAEKSVTIAEQQLRIARSGHQPRVNAFASYDFNSGNFSKWEGSWLAGVNVQLDVFDGYQTRGKIAEARANLDAAREQFRKVTLGIQLEVKQAQLNLTAAQARLTATASSVAQAEESLQITKDRYAGGLALLTQLLDAETALTAARQRRIAAEIDVFTATADLDKALGTLTKE